MRAPFPFLRLSTSEKTQTNTNLSLFNQNKKRTKKRQKNSDCLLKIIVSNLNAARRRTIACVNYYVWLSLRFVDSQVDSSQALCIISCVNTATWSTGPIRVPRICYDAYFHIPTSSKLWLWLCFRFEGLPSLIIRLLLWKRDSALHDYSCITLLQL